MNFSGHIQGGRVVLDESFDLPDGTRVLIMPLENQPALELHPDISRLAGLLPEHIDIDKIRLESILEKHT